MLNARQAREISRQYFNSLDAHWREGALNRIQVAIIEEAKRGKHYLFFKFNEKLTEENLEHISHILKCENYQVESSLENSCLEISWSNV